MLDSDVNTRRMRSKIIQEILDEMDKAPWHVKLRRWWRLKLWIYRCLIFNRKWL